MSSSSDSSPAPSPSPPASPEASYHGPPDLERLIQHFVTAKRALTTTSLVYRANELVTGSKSLIEEIATLSAKNSFAKSGIEQQIDTLNEIKDGVYEVGDKAGSEFDEVVRGLDAANDRLQATLRALHETVIEASLQRTAVNGIGSVDAQDEKATGELSPEAERESKTLFDFINEAQHEELLADLRELIDTYNGAKEVLDEKVNAFEASIRDVEDSLRSAFQRDILQTKPSIYDQDPPLTIPSLSKGMEEHAVALAQLLESLLSHYDLCVNALKHTEGGGEAAKVAVRDAEGLTLSNHGVEDSFYGKKVPEKMDDHERRELLAVVEHDAAEVEDVVAEVRDRASNMEGLWDELSRHVTTARATFRGLRNLLTHLHAFEVQLPGYLDASSRFLVSWEEIRGSILTKTSELTDLTAFYSDFMSSYARLLGEIERRQAMEKQMRKVATKAQKELDRLFAADRDARATFMDEVGEYLPRDLWPGLDDAGISWQITEKSNPMLEHD